MTHGMVDGTDSKLVARGPWSTGLIGLIRAGDKVIDELAAVKRLLQPFRSGAPGVVPEGVDRSAELGVYCVGPIPGDA